MPTSTTMIKHVLGIGLTICLVAPIASQAEPTTTSTPAATTASSPVVVTNTADAPVPTRVTNTVPTTVNNSTANPIPSVITNTSANLINTKVWNTVAVVVGNAKTAPIPTTTIITPAQYEVTFFQGNGASFPTSSSFTVPAGKQYVIEGVSCFAYAINSTDVYMTISTTAGGTRVSHYINGFKQALGTSSSNFILGMTPIPIYADAGSTVTVSVVRQSQPTDNIGYYEDVTFSGHFL